MAMHLSSTGSRPHDAEGATRDPAPSRLTRQKLSGSFWGFGFSIKITDYDLILGHSHWAPAFSSMAARDSITVVSSDDSCCNGDDPFTLFLHASGEYHPSKPCKVFLLTFFKKCCRSLASICNGSSAHGSTVNKICATGDVGILCHLANACEERPALRCNICHLSCVDSLEPVSVLWLGKSSKWSD